MFMAVRLLAIQHQVSMKRVLPLLVFLVALAARGEFPTTQPYPAVTYAREVRADPPQSIYVIIIDLSDPKVRVRVAPGGPDPDGPGEWQTTLQTVRTVAEREHFDVAVNASYFQIP